jgi:predicted secreted protein
MSAGRGRYFELEIGVTGNVAMNRHDMSARPPFATILCVALLISAGLPLKVEAAQGSVQMQILREQDAGKTVDVPVGDVAEIRLSENPTTGYRWTITQFGEKNCAVVHDQFVAPADKAYGAGGEHIWQLRAIAPGDCEIELIYSRASGNAEPRIYRVRLHVP